MDSFVRIYKIYRAVSRSWAARHIYGRASGPWRFGLWSTKVAFVWFAGAQFYFVPAWAHFFAMLLSASVWGFCFDRARRAAFADKYRLYPERIKYFERDYQYLRYLEFRERLQSGSYAGSIEDALKFLNEQIDTDSQTAIAAHPVMTVLIGTLLAIVGAAAGQWQAKFIIYTLLTLLVGMYFSAMILGMLQTKQADLKEFKRFLLWAKSEQIET